MAKILITESIHPSGPELLKKAGHQVVMVEGRDYGQVKKGIADADAVIVRIMELPRPLLETAEKLKIVSKHGVGIDNIDLEYCREAGIAVTVTPNANSLSVAEHAFALMMALAKNVIPVSNAYRENGFSAKNHKEGVEISEKTLGLIGLGSIGSRFADMAVGGFHMKVLAYDPYIAEAPDGVILVRDLEELLKKADFISLHCALVPETRHMINAERLAQMKPSAFLINCARGALVDEAALVEALQKEKLAGAGLDVTDPEPEPADSLLFRMPNVIVTPHYAPSTMEAAARVSQMAAENIRQFLSGMDPEGRKI